ncbi:deoxyribodipyrimidine photolyase [Natronomonas pharaonis DSM 2160]|uniref:Cryptochrome DASH n=1 Tax=Natronomonas pharaonis (strain ATCC 35678 / DSM 2160 / CIP 103997 / JCM 8858 / NBRC 14720 / NCIMB 2260 / Gabara) TaxID=348780 RepID=CRYD_NATPD|nr:DASH family cryptochrome [Natronomonas pharaonis]Q3IPX9.1 RecName: Full=Cryptochrome DASH [Natronomonas pharaonis DSM 2160]CAI49819.1 deoxyribodipyrimidine photolyase [Natronomonas pharaonis DSM 2160]
MDTAVVWFRDDLRVTDNPTLADAVAAAETVIPVYTFDPDRYTESEYGPPKTGGHRAVFRRQAVADLRASLRDRGGDLLVRSGRPATVVPELAQRAGADAVYAQTKPATEERRRAADVASALDDAGIALRQRWTHTLYHPDDLPTPPTDIDDTFTPWRKETEAAATVRDPRSAPETVPTPDGLTPGPVPTVESLGVSEPPTDDRAVLEFEGGESAGKRRVESYIWEGDHLREYKTTRNGLLGADYSSKFSPWLAAGCLSPRWLHREVERYEDERVANEDTYWLVFELAWRDFFQFQFEKYGATFFKPGGIRERNIDWDRDRALFERWADGETGVPFVDANMRELNRTGYMSNRGRQNVASFLAGVLGIDWRWGAAYFEARLIDYDVASNWGNWAYQAGVGNDSRDRYFDVRSQAERYDSDAEYITTWLPELAALPATIAHQPWQLSEAEQREYGVELGVDYPEPVVDIDARYQSL